MRRETITDGLTWSVSIDAESPRPVTENEVFAVMDALSHSVGTGGNNTKRFGARFSAAGEDAPSAIRNALARWAAVLGELGLQDTRVVGIEALTYEDLEVEQSRPSLPQFGGVAEVARILRVPEPRVLELTRSRSFPRPAFRLAAGPVWFKAGIEVLAESWEPEPTGGPVRR